MDILRYAAFSTTPSGGNPPGVHRVLFLFVGIVRRQFLQVRWNQAEAVIYTQSTKVFAVYTTKPTKRAIPAMAVLVGNLTDAQALARAAQVASAAPRLDVI